MLRIVAGVILGLVLITGAALAETSVSGRGGEPHPAVVWMEG